MFRLSCVLALLYSACLPSLLRAETPADILDTSVPKPPSLFPEKKPDSPPIDKTAVNIDEPGFKASTKFQNVPEPNYDLGGGKIIKDISVPKKSGWSVPLEDGAAPPAPGAADQQNAADDKNIKFVEDISPTLAAAIAREKAGQTKPADMLALYKSIALSESQSAAAHYRLGLSYVRNNETQKGLLELEAAIALQPKFPKYLCDYSITALQAGWIEKAFAACNAAVSISPNNPRYLSTLGDIHLAAGHPTDAAEVYTRALKLDPQNANYFYNLGLAYMHARSFKRAVEIINEAIRLKPKTSMFYCSRGLAFENLKNFKMAIEDYVAAIKLDEKNPYAHYLYAGIYSDPEDPTYTNRFEAVEHAEKAVKLTNYKNAQYLMGLARALRVAHNYEQAVESAKKAVDLEPGRADYRAEYAKYEQYKREGIDR